MNSAIPVAAPGSGAVRLAVLVEPADDPEIVASVTVLSRRRDHLSKPQVRDLRDECTELYGILASTSGSA